MPTNGGSASTPSYFFRLNDYDFGQGTVPTVTDANRPRDSSDGAAATSVLKTFPSRGNEPFIFLNLDLYAQHSWRVTRKLT